MQLINRLKNQKSLIESFFSLSILNGLNVILPLITLPYILRIVGPANYGVYSFVYVTIQYVLIVSSYGFDFSATKQISQHRNDEVEVNKIFNAVIITKLILSLFGILILLTFSPLFIRSKDNYLLLLYGVGIVFGDIFIPVWLFQGLEKMRYLTLVNVISKLFFTLLIFIVVKKGSDYKYILLLNSLGYIIAGIFSTFIVIKAFHIRFMRPVKKDVIFQLKDGLAVFGSTLGMNFYRNSNVFILRFFVNDSMVGIYAAAEKVIKAIQGIASPMVQALFPHFGFRFKTMSEKDNVSTLFRVTKLFSVLLLIIALSTFLFSPYIIRFFGGKEFIESIPLVKIMSLVIFFGGINYLLGIVGLINLNKQTAFFITVTLSGIVSMFFLVIFGFKLGIYAAAWSKVISEIILFLSFSFILQAIKHKNK